jgi:hypothetical protein
MIFQMSQPVETGRECPPLCLVGPTEKYGCMTPPNEKRSPAKYTKKLAPFRTFTICYGPYGRYEENALHKAGVGANRPRVKG